MDTLNPRSRWILITRSEEGSLGAAVLIIFLQVAALRAGAHSSNPLISRDVFTLLRCIVLFVSYVSVAGHKDTILSCHFQ